MIETGYHPAMLPTNRNTRTGYGWRPRDPELSQDAKRSNSKIHS